jgi:hypothetical protein
VEAVVAAVTAASLKPAPAVSSAAPGVVQAGQSASAAAVHAPPVPAPAAAASEIASGAVGEAGALAKKKKLDSCFKCKQVGHFIDECTVPTCDFCESIHHVSAMCNLLQAPKPSVNMYGYASEALMFFELPMTGSFRPKVENAKLAKVTVEGDPMTIPQIIDQLKWIVPSDNFQWEVSHYHNNIYRVRFPSKMEVQRMKHYRTYQVPDRASDLVFDQWSVMEEPFYLLPEVWVQVAGIPSDVRTDFLALWGLGSLFGKTSEVDMAYTRKNKILRIKIGCLDSSLIPKSMDVFIRRGFFKLDFQVETEVVQQDVVMNDLPNNPSRDKDDDGRGQEKDSANDMDVEHANAAGAQPDSNLGGSAKGTSAGTTTRPLIQFGTLPLSDFYLNDPGSVAMRKALSTAAAPTRSTAGSSRVGQAADHCDPAAVSRPERISAQVAGADPPLSLGDTLVDAAAMSMGTEDLSPIYDAVLVVEREAAGSTESSPIISCELNPVEAASQVLPTSTTAAVIVDNNIEVCNLLSVDSISNIDDLCTVNNECQASVSKTQRATVLSEPSLEEVIAFGGIPCVDSTKGRSSSRIRSQVDADDTQMARAMKITQQRNNVYSPGIASPQKFSFTSFSHDEIVSRALRIGVSLGKNLDEELDSVRNLKSIEEERNIRILQKNIDETLREDDGPSNLLVSDIASLCEDLIEDEGEDLSSIAVEQSCPTAHHKKTRQRKVYDLSRVRRSSRKRTPKVY